MISQVVNNLIRFKATTLRADLYDYSDAYIVVKGTTAVEGRADREKKIEKKQRTNSKKLRTTY